MDISAFRADLDLLTTSIFILLIKLLGTSARQIIPSSPEGER